MQKMKCRAVLASLCFAVTLSAVAAQPEPQPLEIGDLWSESWIGDVDVSPDGRWAAYTLNTINRAKNGYETHIYEVSTSGGAHPVQLTRGDVDDSMPRYSPDGKWLAFLSDRDGTTRIFLMRRQGGEPFAPFSIESDAGSIAWSPDSARICFLARAQEPKPETDVKVIRRYRYRLDGAGYLGEKEEQIYEGDVATGKTRQLTEDLFSVGDPVYSPDSATIVFVANVTEEHDFNYNTDVCTVPSGGGKITRLTRTAEGEARPRYSPDGNSIAYLRARRADDYYAMSDLWVMSRRGDGAVSLTRRVDRNVNYEGYNSGDWCAPRWAQDGRSIHILLQVGPNTVLYRCSTSKPGEAAAVLSIEGQIEYPHTLKGTKRILHGRQTPTEDTELYVSDLDGGSPVRLTFHQRERLAGRHVGRPEKLAIRSFDGAAIDGWMLKPPGFDSGKKYPLIFTIHGGPVWYYGNIFYPEMQVWAARGYIVLFTNPRGSSGYGQAFADAVKGDWGNIDYKDMMAAVDAAVSTGYVDEKRMGVTGLSYGGIMTNWIVSHTKRFRAAISEEGLSNYASSYGTDDSQIDWENELGLPWKNEALYKRLSPITYAQDVETPLLIIHGEDDYRTAIDQAEQWFITLKRLGKNVVFLRYPRESHEWRYSGEPAHRFDRMKRVIDWWDKHLL